MGSIWTISGTSTHAKKAQNVWNGWLDERDLAPGEAWAKIARHSLSALPDSEQELIGALWDSGGPWRGQSPKHRIFSSRSCKAARDARGLRVRCQDSAPARGTLRYVPLLLSLPMSAKEAWLAHPCHNKVRLGSPIDGRRISFCLASTFLRLLGQVISNWLKRQTQRGLTLATELLDGKLDRLDQPQRSRNHGFIAHPKARRYKARVPGCS